MKKVKIQKEILAWIDFNNTVMGGSVEPQLLVNEQDAAIQLILKAPSITAETVKINIQENTLWIYQIVPVKSSEGKAFMPRTFGQFDIPQNIDKQGITARYEENKWLITLPKDNTQKNFQREIDLLIN